MERIILGEESFATIEWHYGERSGKYLNDCSYYVADCVYDEFNCPKCGHRHLVWEPWTYGTNIPSPDENIKCSCGLEFEFEGFDICVKPIST